MWGYILPCRFQLFGVLQLCLRERSSESIWPGEANAKYIETFVGNEKGARVSTEKREAKLLPKDYK